MLARSSQPTAVPRVDVASSRGTADWREHARCRDFPFKEMGEDPWYPSSTAQEETSWGMRICAGCPVLEICWADALANEPTTKVHGVRAGRTSAERLSVYRKRTRDAAKARAEAALADEKAA